MIASFKFYKSTPYFLKKIIFVVFFLGANLTVFSQADSENKPLSFIINYKTLKPISIKRSVLYYSNTKNNLKSDSLVIYEGTSLIVTDTFNVKNVWKFPLFMSLKFECGDIKRVSNEFYYYPGNNTWEVSVGDAALNVTLYNFRSFTNPNKSSVGLVLLFQAIIEVLLALMMSRMIGWSRAIIIMVLAANIATFPLYQLNFPTVYMREFIVFGVKALVMVLIGFKKIKVYKIVLFGVILSIISLGFKEILFVLLRII